MIEKLKFVFDENVVYKDLQKTSYFSTLKLPSFLRDWLLRKFEDEEGNFDPNEVNAFVKEYIPGKEDWNAVKNRLIYLSERVKILTRVHINIDIRTETFSFSMPEYSLSEKDTLIRREVWDRCQDELVSGCDIWGVITLGYQPPYIDSYGKKIPGKITMEDFKNFCPYENDLDFFKDARQEFETHEWIDLLLGAIDYNAAGYKDEHEKLMVLTRLLPFVEKNLNLIELAPKGTGKSYMFGNISKYGTLIDGGMVTRAKMFYDLSSKQPGFIHGNDFVAIDEVKLVQFGNDNEMRSILQGYMENAKYDVAGVKGQAEAGVVFLGNIMVENMNIYRNMMSELPTLFNESALLDRVHGFIKGWEIPDIKENMKICGWGLNTEYFSTIMHMLRSDASYRAIVDQLLIVPETARTRDTEAVKRIATGYMKLLFPNVRSPKDIHYLDFLRYCLRPAVQMREIVLIQLGILDDLYKGKDMPKFEVKDFNENA